MRCSPITRWLAGLLALGLVTSPARAEPLPAREASNDARSVGERGPDGSSPGSGEESPARALPFRGSGFEWSHSTTTLTSGLGSDVQTRNAFYEMTFGLTLRYVLAESANDEWSLKAKLGAFREFTNSDTTTERGEWSLTDSVVASEYRRTLWRRGRSQTRWRTAVPVLEAPTSKASSSQGMMLRLGATTSLEQSVPLGSRDAWLSNLELSALVGYAHTFTRATEAVGVGFQRVRMGLDGRAVPGDQLGGVAFAQHQASLLTEAEVEVTPKLGFAAAFGWRPSWGYTFDDSGDVCVEALTGCATPRRVDDPSRYSVVTLFETRLTAQVARPLDLVLGYQNLAFALAPDGQRRNVLYSPDARLFLAINLALDELYVVLAPTENDG